MKVTALRHGREIAVYVQDEATGLLVRVAASALNLPDAKLAARGAITKLQYALDRLSMADVKDGPS